MKQSTLILASSSPARKKLLEKLGIPFIVKPSGYEENMQACENPEQLAELLALGKAQHIAKDFPNAIIIGADTFLTVGHEKIGKPTSRQDAQRILKLMSNQIVNVYTGVAIIRTTSNGNIRRQISFCETAMLKIKKMSPDEITMLAHQPDALNISGAFSIEGEGGKMIASIHGDYDSVIGIPIKKLQKLLTEIA